MAKQAGDSCCICFDPFPGTAGVACCSTGGPGGGSGHFVCNGCFGGHVQAEIGKDLGERQHLAGSVFCPQHSQGCSAPPYSDQTVAIRCTEGVFAAYVAARTELAEQRIIQEQEGAFLKRLEKERARFDGGAAGKPEAVEDAIQRHRAHVVENILTLHCPHCGAAFVDFEGCFALKCSRCRTHFCAYCVRHETKRWDESHVHVATCPYNVAPGKDVYASVAVFEKAQRRRRDLMLREYLQSSAVAALEPADALALIEALAQDLTDLGMKPDAYMLIL